MKHQLILHKQTLLGRQYAHLAEHFLANNLVSELAKHGKIEFFDFMLEGMTRDNNLLLWFSCDESDVLNLAKKYLLKTSLAAEPKKSDVIKSIDQISLEYDLKPVYGIEKVSKNLKTVLAQDWSNGQTLKTSAPTYAPDWSLEADGLKYLKNSSFSKIIGEIKLDMAVRCQDPGLKPLAVLVLTAILDMTHVLPCTEARPMYLSNSYWQEFLYEHNHELVGLSLEFKSFTQDAIDKDYMIKLIEKYRQYMLDNAQKLCVRIQQYIVEDDELDLMNRLFDRTGILIGQKGWQESLIEENIRPLAKNIEIY